MKKDFQAFVNKYKVILDQKLFTYVEDLHAPRILKDAMAYSLKAGGKRIRPLLLYAVLDAFENAPELGAEVACAIEMIHTYSLIHDDLPAMDNDDYRRGMPTNHKIYGEDMAILAGDGLLTYSFFVVANCTDLTFEKRVRLIQEIAAAAGPEGMVAGQVLDMEAEGKSIDIQELEQIHLNKTGRMIVASLLCGAIIAEVPEEIQKKLRMFGTYLGLAFQIQDDILDKVGETKKIGKPVGSDVENKKSTYVTLTSVETAKTYLLDTYQNAVEILDTCNLSQSYLKNICDWIANRSN